MGLQDRDYSRERSQGYGSSWSGNTGDSSWGASSRSLFGGGDARSITVTLVIINVIVFFLDMLLSGRGDGRSVMIDWFAVRGDTIAQPWMWYRFLTYGFVHSDANIWHLVGNMFGLFVFGRNVEQRMGRGEFLRFYVVAVLIGGIVASLRWALPALASGEAVSLVPTIGASGAVIAVTILFAFYFPDATVLLMLVFPMKAWLLAVIYVVLNVLGMIGAGGGHVAYEVHLAGAGFAALYHLKSWRLEFLRFDALSLAMDAYRRRRPKLKLHDPEKKLAKQEAEVDRILDKIQLSGLDSLTAGERRTLERHSRLKRQQRS